MTLEKMNEILSALSVDMRVPLGNFGFEPGQCRGVIKQLQEQGYVGGIAFAEGSRDVYPQIMWMERGYVTAKGLQFISDYQKKEVNLTQELISACGKLADNPVSYSEFDEDGLNREIRNMLEMAIARFGFTVADQTQQGMSKAKPGELDIRISRHGIPVAVFEGLVQSSRKYLYDHLDRAIGKYNISGCKSVYVVEYSRNKGFGGFWDGALEALKAYERVSVREENTGLLGVRMLKGSYEWEGRQGDFCYMGVNCYAH